MGSIRTTVSVRHNPFTMSNTEISNDIIGLQDSSLTARDGVHRLYKDLDNIVRNSTRIENSLQQKLKGFKSFEVKEGKITYANILPSAHTLKEISCQMTCHSFNARAPHETVVWILKRLRNYSWDAKAVIALVAFAMDYGEPRLLSLVQHATDSTILRVQLFKFGGEEENRRGYLEKFQTLVEPTLQLIRGIIELGDLVNDKTYSPSEVPALSTVQPEAYTYWAIFALLACASRNTELEWGFKISEIVRKVNAEISHLDNAKAEVIGQIAAVEDYKQRLRVFQNAAGVPELLKALIYPRDYSPLEIYDNYHKKVVPIDVLKSRHLLLFISPLDNIEDDIFRLIPINTAFRRDKDKQDYSILWVPIVENWNEENTAQFDHLKSLMPWYVTKYPSLVAGMRPLKELWFYMDKPIVVVVNPRGKIINKTAIHLIFGFGIDAFPFDDGVYEILSQHWRWFWDEATKVYQSIGSWIKDDNYIFIYEASDIPGTKSIEALLESIKRDPITQKADASIQYYNLRKAGTSKFWESITNSFLSKVPKDQTAQDQAHNDMLKLLTLRDERGWILFSRGRNVLEFDNDAIMSSVLAEYDTWKVDVGQKLGFDDAFRDYYKRKRAQVKRGCSHFHLDQLSSADIPVNVECPDPNCSKKMGISYVYYNCCHGENYKHDSENAGNNLYVPVYQK